MFGIAPGPYYDEFGNEISWIDYQWDWITRNNARQIEQIEDLLAGTSEPQGSEGEDGVFDRLSDWLSGDDGPAPDADKGSWTWLIVALIGAYLIFSDK